MSNVVRTYRQLLTALQELTPEQLDMSITVEDSYEGCFESAEFQTCLNGGHPVIRFQNSKINRKEED